jgi:hypothetical protein
MSQQHNERAGNSTDVNCKAVCLALALSVEKKNLKFHVDKTRLCATIQSSDDVHDQKHYTGKVTQSL